MVAGCDAPPASRATRSLKANSGSIGKPADLKSADPLDLARVMLRECLGNTMNIAYETFTPLASLAGGILIGISASLMLLLNGRVAGISGIVGGLLAPARGELGWRVAFVGGLVAGGAILAVAAPELFAGTVERSSAALIVAGLLVGFGTRLGSGCTSGHGVCGLSRGSLRSLVATATFMATGMAAAYLVGHWLGGKV